MYSRNGDNSDDGGNSGAQHRLCGSSIYIRQLWQNSLSVLRAFLRLTVRSNSIALIFTNPRHQASCFMHSRSSANICFKRVQVSTLPFCISKCAAVFLWYPQMHVETLDHRNQLKISYFSLPAKVLKSYGT